MAVNQGLVKPQTMGTVVNGPMGSGQMTGVVQQGLDWNSSGPSSYAPGAYDEYLQTLLTRQDKQAQQSLDTAKNFSANLPNYLNPQYSAALDSGLTQLQSANQATKASANSRGLLYSGVPAAGYSNNEAQAGSQVATNIQGINSEAMNKQNQFNQQATDAFNTAGNSALNYANFKATQAETKTSQDIQQNKDNSQYWTSMLEGVGVGLAGLIGLMLL